MADDLSIPNFLKIDQATRKKAWEDKHRRDQDDTRRKSESKSQQGTEAVH